MGELLRHSPIDVQCSQKREMGDERGRKVRRDAVFRRFFSRVRQSRPKFFFKEKNTDIWASFREKILKESRKEREKVLTKREVRDIMRG